MVPGEGNGEQKVGRGLQGEKLGRVEHERVCVQLCIPQQCVPASLLRSPARLDGCPDRLPSTSAHSLSKFLHSTDILGIISNLEMI